MRGLLALLLWAAPALADPPVMAPQRVIFRTVAGDLVFALYPEVAPRTVEQFLKLAKLGVFDTTHFYRVESNFVVQLSSHWDRERPLSDEQRASVRRIPLEVATGVLHTPWVLSMAREDKDPDSAETSFSILLVQAPHLDGKYTVFGKMERGFDVILEMLKAPRDASNRPLTRLGVTGTDVVDSAALATAGVRPATAVLDARGAEGKDTDAVRVRAALPVALVGLLCLLVFLLRARLPPRHLVSINLLGVLVSVYALLVLLVPQGGISSTIGLAVFIALIATFKLMSRFESY